MEYHLIETPQGLHDLQHQLSAANWIALDTEFVSEHSYVPKLCLMQLATDAGLFIVDTLKLRDVSSLWELLVLGEHETIVHAGREELRFCYRAVQRIPKRWFDVQLAAGLVSTEYPASYHKLLQRWLGLSISKHETRTDWTRRPLGTTQLEYALEDVAHLQALRAVIGRALESKNRLSWLEQETSLQLQRALSGLESQPWVRIRGSKNLGHRAQAIVRRLWEWREELARETDVVPSRILRDDLVVEIAKRAFVDPAKIMAIRGMPKRIEPHLPTLSDRIRQGLKDAESRPGAPRELPPQVELIGQFLNLAVNLKSREHAVATVLLATSQEVRDFVAQRLGFTVADESPILHGWRWQLLGNLLDQLLQGRSTLRVVDPQSAVAIGIESTPRMPD